MGEDACYLRLVDDRGRLQEGPVITWGLDSGVPPPAGVPTFRLDAGPPTPERMRFLLNLASDGGLLLLYRGGEEEAADALAAELAERLKKK